MTLIAIDMTPMFPGGENGGAKLVAMELIKGFQTISNDNRFLILTASWNDDELSCLDSPNTRRLRIVEKPDPKVAKSLPGPEWVARGLRKLYLIVRRQYSEKLHSHGPLHDRGVDVLFCPFTALTYAEAGIPAISVIHDLQHKDYPQFFSREVIDWRDTFIAKVCRRADAIICVSESTRKSALAHLKIDPANTYTIHNCIQGRLKISDKPRVSEHLEIFKIARRSYMFYPANFWPHKNHQMLITAYGMYVARHPKRRIDLVFTGALDEAKQELKDKVRRMGLEKRIHFLGYLPEEKLASVWQGCSFLVFPSLYEGFGIPVLEAMQFGKPVLCSNVTSLPEVAGDAALYFDPRNPHEIVRCMEKIVGDRKLRVELVNKGYARLSNFQPEDMAKKYLKVIGKVKDNPRKYHDTAKGIYADGWTGSKLDISYCYDQPGRILELIIEVPPGVPYKKATVKLGNNSAKNQKWVVAQGQRHEIEIPLSGNGNRLNFEINPTFVPSKFNMGADNRELGVLCRGCCIISPDGERVSLWFGK